MTYWPEKESAIGVRLAKIAEIDVCAAFGM